MRSVRHPPPGGISVKLWCLILVLMASSVSMAKGQDEELAFMCNQRMQSRLGEKKAGEQAVADAMQVLHDPKLGLKNLLRDFDNGEVEVQFKRPWLPLMQDPVSARISMLNKKYIVIRKVDVSTPERKQLFTWRIAMALFELQMEPALWSGAAVFPDDLPVYVDTKEFLARLPRTWADERMDLSKRLMNDLYTLFSNLPDIGPDTIMPPTDKTGELYAATRETLGIKQETAMPEKDPGLYWKVKAAVLRDASQDIGPNAADYSHWLRAGHDPIDQALNTRHANSTLFNYYMNHLKRMLMVTSLLTTLAWSPHLLMIPSYIESHNIDVERSHQLSTTAMRNDDIERKTHEIYVENQIQEINQSITVQENTPNPNKDYIASLKKTLQALVDQNPHSIYMTANSPARAVLPH